MLAHLDDEDVPVCSRRRTVRAMKTLTLRTLLGEWSMDVDALKPEAAEKTIDAVDPNCSTVGADVVCDHR